MSSSLTMASIGSGVYIGAWINWSYGMFFGATLTLTNNQGLILVSFLTIFVGMTGGALWGILVYLLHQTRASNRAKDGLFHQQQVVLRNSQSASGTMWELVKMGWAWRGRAQYSMWRIVPLILLATVQMVVFVMAGIFSSMIFSTSQEVLLRGPSCGFLALPPARDDGSYNQTQFEMLDATFIDEKTTATWSLTYSRSCYAEVSTECDYFSVPKIEPSFETTSCPFAPEMCLDPKRGALVADTGFINSNYHLGINSKVEESIDYRRVTTCAPLTTEGFMAVNDDRYLTLFYGHNTIEGGSNETWYYDTWAANGTYTPYTPINYRDAFVNSKGSSSFTPIPQLSRTDADVTLVFVVNNVEYLGIRDPSDMWYNGTEKVPDRFKFGRSAYRSPNSVQVMGCTEQHQFCQANGTACSPLTGWFATGQEDEFQGAQLSVIHSLFQSLSDSMVGDMVSSLGAQALLASTRLLFSVELSAPLPADFWKEEVKSWQNYSLSHMQKAVVGIAKGPANPNSRRFVVAPDAADQAAFNICDNIRVRDGGFYSFKIIGLIITVTAGSLLIIANCSLDIIVGWVQRRRKRGHDRREDWELDHLLQLQRMALEGAKLGTWARNDEGSVPVTIKALGMQKFGKPGRGVGTYESVASADMYADHVGQFSQQPPPPPSSTFTPAASFTDFAGEPPIHEVYHMESRENMSRTRTREFV